MSFQVDIGNAFLAAREKAGLTQAQVAEKAGINANYYAVLERGEKNARGNIINNIAKALNVKIQLPLES